jgi:hypothetical protein
MSDFPIMVCEDDPRWASLCAHYSHIGCPGIEYEDNCGAPWECASFGKCRRLLESEGFSAEAKDFRHMSPIQEHIEGEKS